ncbi:Type III effector avrRpt2 [Pseudomonas syringae pv. maculicola]|nr:Type III effector avrRpt2 [Pseudomonas syringae pv. maculicola]
MESCLIMCALQGPDLAMPLDYFNQRLAWQVPHAMLYR